MEISLDSAPHLVCRRDNSRPRGGELGSALGDLHLERVSGFAKAFFCPPALMDEARVLKRHRGMIGRGSKQDVINLARKVNAITHRRDQTALRVHSNGNHNRPA
ncbi:MAG: hypothetical protein M3046_14065 [Actinomycetota bacterium]|nr:hypothetical protein [Actinomycetota bacterium]